MTILLITVIGADFSRSVSLHNIIKPRAKEEKALLAQRTRQTAAVLCERKNDFDADHQEILFTTEGKREIIQKETIIKSSDVTEKRGFSLKVLQITAVEFCFSKLRLKFKLLKSSFGGLFGESVTSK